MNIKILLIFILFFTINQSYSQKLKITDSVDYKKFLPDYVKLQFAGGIGFLSAGVGYTFFHNKLDLTGFYGYVPKKYTYDGLSSISFQATFKFFRFKISPNTQILPLNLGFFSHYTLGKDFWIKLPDNYPPGYYWWKPGRVTGIFMGGEVKTNLFASKTPASGTAFYTRIGTRVLYLSSKFGNSSIKVKDIVELGFGVTIYR
ncbi:MAG: hypothetical protein IMY72_10255 [Bacteroidetes bacterium]|nr:hypothetical protein [Bacteroidota bacterium]